MKIALQFICATEHATPINLEELSLPLLLHHNNVISEWPKKPNFLLRTLGVPYNSLTFCLSCLTIKREDRDIEKFHHQVIPINQTRFSITQPRECTVYATTQLRIHVSLDPSALEKHMGDKQLPPATAEPPSN